VSKTPTEFKLEDLARAAGVSPRTVRYYVQRGLLPAPTFRAKDTAYDQRHLLLLRAIKKLQEAFFPLDAIASTLANVTEDELSAIANGTSKLTPTQAVKLATSVATTVDHGETVTRYDLVEGVELLVSGHASARARALVEEIVKLAHANHGGKR
jgi:DNA-binding transcriptional MerR regulator